MKVSYILLAAAEIAWLSTGLMQGQKLATDVGQRTRTPVQVTNGSARFLTPYDPSQKLRLVFGLKPPHPEEEQKFLEALYTPGSPEYHKFLTPQEWNERFSPSPADEQTLVDWANSQGLTVTKRYPNRLIVDVEAPVAQIQRVLSVNVNRYQLNGAAVFSNDRDPVIPPALSEIVTSVVGLNNIMVLHPHSNVATRATFPDYIAGPVSAVVEESHADGSRATLAAAVAAKKNMELTPAITTDGFFEPTDLYSSNAYNFAGLQNLGHCCNPNHVAGGSPPETSIAILSFGSMKLTDIQGFHDKFPYLAYNVTIIHVDGTSTTADGEGTLDVEWATAMANSFGPSQDTAHVYIYEGANPTHQNFLDAYNQMLTDGHARVMSTSWGGAEVLVSTPTDISTENQVLSAMAGQGWTLVGITGDHGSVADCGHSFPTVEFPASSPNVIAAGGTSLLLNSNGTYNSEVAWTGDTFSGACSFNDGGSGGGFSAFFGVPFYQAFLGHGVRTLPDLSLNAQHSQAVFIDGTLQSGSGTSIVAPELAGFFAQENAYLLFLQTHGVPCFGNHACAPIGNANAYIYAEQQHAPAYAPHYPFYDITSGCNSNDVTINNPSSFYCATPGYDLVTGLGSANMLQLAWAINYNAAGDFGPPSVEFTGPPVNKWYNTDQQVNMGFFDTTASPRPATGLAGFSLAWDHDPAPESFSKSTPGSNDAFYTGPQFPNQDRGVLILSFAGQGCHTARAKAWDNTGTSSGLLSYGPICYDTVAPATTATLSGTKSGTVFTSDVKLTLAATDASSGVATRSYKLDSGALITYTAPFTVSTNGMHTVQYFSKDVAGNAETPHSTTFTVQKAAVATTTKVTSSLNPSTFGANITFTAKVTPSSGAVPTGNVTFRDGSAVIGTIALSNGQAILVTKALHAGSHTITALYAGNANDKGSTSPSLIETVKKAATTAAVASSLNPSTFGKAVTFTATITPASGTLASGSVTFKDGTATLGSAALNTSTHKATFTTTALAAGSHSITAVYPGSVDHTGSTSAALKETVNKAATSTTLASSLNPSTHGQTVTFTATVTPASGGTLSGTVTFKNGTATLGTAGVNTSTHKATFATAGLAVGTRSITAVYAGNTNLNASTAAALNQVVK